MKQKNIKESYESEKSRRIVFDDSLPEWNELIMYSWTWGTLESHFFITIYNTLNNEKN